MASRGYSNFDLSIERIGDRYRVRVLQSAVGKGIMAEFKLPLSDGSPIGILSLKIGRSRRGVRRGIHASDSEELVIAKQFGETLFNAVFQKNIYNCLNASLQAARAQNQGLRVLLRLPADLAQLPWEYIYNSNTNQFLAVSTSTPLVRYLELTPNIEPLEVTPPLRMLVAISSPEDYRELDVEREWRTLQDALQPLVARGAVIIDRLASASPSQLQAQLRQADYHIFHFIGHSIFEKGRQNGVLIFNDENGHGKALNGQMLGTLLADHPSLRLVVLNSCEGARTGIDDPFAGLALSLVQMGLPAVIAMQYEISDDAAILFAREFYRALADGYGVDAALGDARKAIFTNHNSVEWGTPVLFTRTLDGRIFDLAPAPPAVTPDVVLARHYEDGLSAFHLEDWPRAQECFQTVVRIRPDYRDTARLLEKVREKMARPQPVQGGEKSASWFSRYRKNLFWVGLALIVIIVGWMVMSGILQGLPSNQVPTRTSTLPSKATSTPILTVTPTLPPGMVLIPAGPFQMGSNKAYDEEPIHTVNLNAFLMDKYEVTNADYAKCVAAKKCSLPGDLSSSNRSDYYSNGKYVNYPVLYVSWNDAKKYCEWRNARLPSESEWEKAARGGLEGKLYPWGDTTPVCTAGAENGSQSDSCSVKDTVAVGSFKPNGYGLYDMIGNALEWVNDWYNESYYSSSPDNNPTGPTSGYYKVLRGGGWYGSFDDMRIAHRYFNDPTGSQVILGFRCAATPGN